jgi:hypothetical protein
VVETPAADLARLEQRADVTSARDKLRDPASDPDIAHLGGADDLLRAWVAHGPEEVVAPAFHVAPVE